MSSGVLVATDRSEASDEALIQGHRHAAQASQTLTAITVLPRLSTTGVDPLFPQDALRIALGIPEMEARAAQAVEDRISALTSRRGTDVLVRLGEPEDEIVKCAAELGVSLIVVGSHGRTGISRMLLGSAAEQIARKAPCDVLVARPAPPQKAGAVVAVATDLSEASEAAMDVAVHEAKRRSARLVAIHAIADARVLAYAELAAAFGASSLGPPPELDSEVSQAVGQLLAKKLADSSVIGEVVLPHGEPARAVVGVVESLGAELLVVGASGARSTLERMALGSVAEKLVRHAHCSVYIARSR